MLIATLIATFGGEEEEVHKFSLYYIYQRDDDHHKMYQIYQRDCDSVVVYISKRLSQNSGTDLHYAADSISNVPTYYVREVYPNDHSELNWPTIQSQ